MWFIAAYTRLLVCSRTTMCNAAVWRNDNGIGPINEVTLRWARLVLGWVSGDRLRPGKPHRYVTSDPAQLSLLSSAGREIRTGQSVMMLCAGEWKQTWLITHAEGSHRVIGFNSICLPVCLPHDFSKTAAGRIIKLDVQNSTMSPGNPFILGKRSKRQGHESQKRCRRGSSHSCECWLLLMPFVDKRVDGR